jgi:hypothetical protein
MSSIQRKGKNKKVFTFDRVCIFLYYLIFSYQLLPQFYNALTRGCFFSNFMLWNKHCDYNK